jgi:opacity protein-like surface antigen
MKVLTGIIVAALLLPFLASAEEEKMSTFLGEGTKEFRLDLNIDPEAGLEGDPGVGFEIGVGASLYQLDTLFIYLGHEDNDGDDLTEIGVMAEEHYPMGGAIVPYAGAGIGYGWNGADTRSDEEAIIFRFDLGTKFRLTEDIALSVSIEFSWADTEIFLEDSKAEDKNIELGLGFRYYY